MNGPTSNVSPASSAGPAPPLTNNTDLSPVVLRSGGFNNSITSTTSPRRRAEPTTPSDPFIGSSINRTPGRWNLEYHNLYNGPWNDPIGTPTRSSGRKHPDNGLGNGGRFVVVIGPQSSGDWKFGGHYFSARMFPSYECAVYHPKNQEFFLKFGDPKDGMLAISHLNHLFHRYGTKGNKPTAVMTSATDFLQVAKILPEFKFFPTEMHAHLIHGEAVAFINLQVEVRGISPSSNSEDNDHDDESVEESTCTGSLSEVHERLVTILSRTVVINRIVCKEIDEVLGSSMWQISISSFELAGMFIQGYEARGGWAKVHGLKITTRAFGPSPKPPRPIVFDGATNMAWSTQMTGTVKTPVTMPPPLNLTPPSEGIISVSSPFSRASSTKANVVDREAIEMGYDCRTTVMLRNIPNRINQPELKQLVDRVAFGRYDFMYLRIDFRNNYNVGYGFFNFASPQDIIPFLDFFLTHNWPHSGKKADVSYATMQGRESLIAKFRNSSVMREVETARPKLYYIAGPLRGQEEPFPGPDNHSKLLRSIQQAGVNGLYGKGRNIHPNNRAVARQHPIVSHYDRGNSFFRVDEVVAENARLRAALATQPGPATSNAVFGPGLIEQFENLNLTHRYQFQGR